MGSRGDDEDDGTVDNLANWSYLTQTFDNGNFLEDDGGAQEMSQAQAPTEPTPLFVNLARTLDAIQPPPIVPMAAQGGPLPSQLNCVPVELVFDATNPLALYLPQQDVNVTPHLFTHSLSVGVGPLPLPLIMPSTLVPPLPTSSTPRDLSQRSDDTKPRALPRVDAAPRTGATHHKPQSFRSMHDCESHRINVARDASDAEGRYQAGSEKVGDGVAATRNHGTKDAAATATATVAVAAAMPGTVTDAFQNNHRQVSAQQPMKRCKPLTAYNYFYRDERDNIVENLKRQGDPLPAPVCDFTEAKKERLLYQHWYVDPVKNKRLHRKTHGKIEFPELSKVIAQRWKALPESGRDFYRQVAHDDRAEYDRYLAATLKT